MREYCFGVDMGGTMIKYGFFNRKGELLESWSASTNRTDGGKHIPQDIADTVLAKIGERNLAKEDIIGMGIGVPGPVTKDGIVIECVNVGWKMMQIAEKMSALTGLYVKAANDANVAALGEMWMGGGKGCKDVVFVTLGTGVGGGVILDGKVRHGSSGAGGEIGHIIVNPPETERCGCGNFGHLEQYASATGIVRITKLELQTSKEESVLRSLQEITAKDVFDAAKQGDKLAFRMVDRMAEYLALALTHIAAVVDPEVFVIGGGVSKAGTIITELVEKHYNRNIMTALKNKEFRLAELENDAGIYGSAKLILE